MAIWSLSNARYASSSACLDAMSEPHGEQRGIYIGRTAIYGIPFLLDLHGNVNPHVAIIGMTGSGKTYLAKSMALRATICDNYTLLIMDWSGEYAQTVDFIGGKRLRLSGDFDNVEKWSALVKSLGLDTELLRASICIDMSELRDSKIKAIASKALLIAVIRAMHEISLDKHGDTMILIDEAWQSVSSSSEISILFREGRKYGISMVITTQMASDINNAVIANAGCIILFKLQNPDDYKLLSSAGILSGHDMEGLTGLGVGSCIVHQNKKDGNGLHFSISHVDGIDTDIVFVYGDKMQVYVPSNKFFNAAQALGDEAKAEISNLVMDSNRRLDLVSLIRLLLMLKIGRPKILEFLYSVGIDDISIVIAYEKAELSTESAK
ncbi:MAG: DUF87 domain-containing protein [Candidatus Marsarchaeota archaeon]|jgi:hypothetical protein|nr:DUF87 domain-containing protein [Candidatus Marsarchaeota archaeon]MCL5419037.1 DUF87 domain-containing protein [Candidatus Marsarchaeota archaeon]